MMSLLLQLGCLEQGNPLPLATLSDTDRGICLDLAYMGLLLPFWCVACPPCTMLMLCGSCATS